jgi:ribonuclease HII
MRLIIPTLELEQSLWCAGIREVVGVDEAGMGPIAGPVVAAAVRLNPKTPMIHGIRDSKTLSAERREYFLAEIFASAAAVGVGAASVDEIGRFNVRRASHLAMARALRRVGQYDHVLIDGNPIRDVALGSHTTIVDGDATSYSIACASVVAKVWRDQLMVKLSLFCPGYGWERNAGYATEQHLVALRTHGLTPYHRRDYAPVRDYLQERRDETSCP